MSEFGEPWVVTGKQWLAGSDVMPCVKDCDNRTVHNGRYGLTTARMDRICAAVNFCEHIPTETLEKLLEAKVGAATFIQWLKRNPTWTLWDEGRAEGEELYKVCIECDHRVGQTGLHAEDCLLPKALEMTEDV